jgi:hypothetical protein
VSYYHLDLVVAFPVNFVCRLGDSFFYLGHFVCHLGLLHNFSDNFVCCLSLLDQGHSFDAIIIITSGEASLKAQWCHPVLDWCHQAKKQD